MFEKASRLKLKFDTVKGLATVDDLWDIPLQSRDGFCLDDLAKALSKSVKESSEESFVEKKSAACEVTELKFSIVKHVIKVKLEEREKAENLILRKAKKEKIIDILAKKKDADLEDKSVDDLEKMLNEL